MHGDAAATDWDGEKTEGRSINLDFDLPTFEHDVLACFFYANNMPYEESTAIIKSCVDMIVNKLCSDKTVYVMENSRLKKDLSCCQGFNKIKTASNVFEVFFRNDKILLIDNNDFASHEIQQVMSNSGFLFLPCNVLTTAHLYMIANYGKYFSKLATIMKAIKRTKSKDAAFFAMTEGHMFIGSILFLLGAVEIVLCPGMAGLRESQACCQHVGSFCLDMLQDKSPCVFVFNDLCFSSGNAYMRNILLRRLDLDYFFVFGKQKTQNNRALFKKPFVLWTYPCSGSNRMFPVVHRVLSNLGMFHVESSNFVSPSRREKNAVQHMEWSRIKDIPETICKMLPPNSYVTIHFNFYEGLVECLAENSIKLFAFVRDYRDIITSTIRLSYACELGQDKKNFERFAIEFMKDDIFSHEPIDTTTKALVQAKSCVDSVFIKFEDVNSNPVHAYMNAFEQAGFTRDPFWVDETMSKIMMEAIQDNAPDAGRGQSGTWKKYFTPAVSAYFKEHANDVLRVFGYEKDASW